MEKIMYFLKLTLVIASLLVLPSCGGGGGGGSSGGSITPVASTLSGVAAVGTPIVGGNISVICAAGNPLSTITSNTGTGGAWQVTLSGQTLPCAVEVSGGNIGTVTGPANTTSYHSIAVTSGTVNVTPLTDLIVANLAGTATPSTWFAGLSSNPTSLTAINQTQVTAALAKLSTALSGLAPLNANNPITTAFTPTSGNVSDDMLTALATAMTNTGITHASLLNNASYTTFTAPVSGFDTALTTAYSGTTSGGGSGSTTGTPSTTMYTIGGTVSGLTGSVVLQDNSGDNLTVTANGTFTFATQIANSSPYNATVLTQPSGQTCSVSTGAGTVSGGNITNVTVVCSTNSYTVGGSVTGLTGSLVLQDNNGDNLTVAAIGAFTFAAKVANGSPYSVTVLTQPSGQTCAVTGGSGTATASVTSVVVNCTNTAPSDTSDCSTAYVPGRVLTIDISTSIPGIPTHTSTIVRSFGADTTFLGQSVQQVIDQDVTDTPAVTTSMYIQNLSTEWIELGKTSTWSGGSETLTYQPMIHNPNQWAIGQTETYSGQIIIAGQPTQTITIQLTTTLVRRESVTVPAGTFYACLFHTDSTSSNSAGTAQGSTDAWYAPNVGEVKMVNTGGSSVVTRVLRQVQ